MSLSENEVRSRVESPKNKLTWALQIIYEIEVNIIHETPKQRYIRHWSTNLSENEARA